MSTKSLSLSLFPCSRSPSVASSRPRRRRPPPPPPPPPTRPRRPRPPQRCPRQRTRASPPRRPPRRSPLEARREHLRRPQARLGRSVRQRAPQVEARQQDRPGDLRLFAKIADNGGAESIGDWTPNVKNWVGRRADAFLKTGALPLFLSYNIPKRDCGQYSAGGAGAADKYKEWITAFATGIGERRAAVVLEPDSLGLLTKVSADGKPCLSEADQKERLELLRFAVHTFEAQGNIAVYIDAGHSGWLKPADDAKRLKEAGIDEADGFALNVSNYKATSTEINYGKAISKLVGGKHFVIDTSRNGNGPPKCDEAADDEKCWCNPPGRALGSPPTASTADPLIDAYLWLKSGRIGRAMQRRPQGRRVLAGQGARACAQRRVLTVAPPQP